MIFCAKNEDGIPTWKLVTKGTKTVTRRVKPLSVGKIFAVQPGRGKKAICHIKVKDCIPSNEWEDDLYNSYSIYNKKSLDDILNEEAKKEGFKTWFSLIKYFYDKGIYIRKTYRIEFEIIKKWR